MANEIILTPQILNIAQGVQGIIEIDGLIGQAGVPQGFDISYLDTPSGYTLSEASRSIFKNRTSFNEYIYGTFVIPKNQSFSLEAQISNEISAEDLYTAIAVIDNLGGTSGFTATQFGGGNFAATAFIHGDLLTLGGSASGHYYRISSDGINLYLHRKTSSTYILIHTKPIPANIESYRFFYRASFQGNSFTNCLFNIGAGNTELTFENCASVLIPNDNALREDISLKKAGITIFDLRSRVFEVTHPELPTVRTQINVAPLYLRPIPANKVYAVVGEEVEFETNGGDSGEFTATTGEIIDHLKWLAIEEGTVEFTYTLGGVSSSVTLEVVPKLEIANVDGIYYNEIIAQGEILYLQSNIPEQTVFTSSTHPTLVTHDGIVVAPVDIADENFGEKVIQIKATALGQSAKIFVKVYGMFPTPLFCGANPRKWRQYVPDKQPIESKTVSGKREARNQNPRGTVTFKVIYRDLLNQVLDGEECLCDSYCENNEQATAKRLDEFYEKFDTTRKFALRDRHTNELFKGVVITRYKDDHILVDTRQSRDIDMYWDGGLQSLD